MATEKFIQGKHDNGHHDGRRSTLRRLQGAIEQIKAWRNEALPAGNSLCYPNEKDGHGQITPYSEGQDQEISQFPQTGIVFDSESPFHKANDYMTKSGD